MSGLLALAATAVGVSVYAGTRPSSPGAGHEHLGSASGCSTLAIPPAAPGFLSPLIAAASVMAFSSIFVVSLRLRRFQPATRPGRALRRATRPAAR